MKLLIIAPEQIPVLPPIGGRGALSVASFKLRGAKLNGSSF
ncbi:hypothetical protein [Paenibacillus sp. BC26]|nr:hypothetical protein [Paenibacillus sp. BC26]SFS87859.1 hypothetical protein SAMN05428962_3415 [Paenibacillus sp. BC26]